MTGKRAVKITFQGVFLQSAASVLAGFFLSDIIKRLPESVQAVICRGIHEQTGRKDQVPARNRGEVSPVEAVPVGTRGIFCVYKITVSSLVMAQEYPVARIDDPIDLGIDIIKCIPQGFHITGNPLAGAKRDIKPRSPAGYHEGGHLFFQRTFQHQPSRNGIKTDLSTGFLAVPLLHGHIHHRRKPSSVTGRDSSLIKPDFPDGIGIEGGKITEEVVGVVYGYPVEENQILVVRPAPDIDPRSPFIS